MQTIMQTALTIGWLLIYYWKTADYRPINQLISSSEMSFNIK